MGGRGSTSSSNASSSPSWQIISALDDWTQDASEFREATQYSDADPDSDAGMLDDWAAGGSYKDVLYRGISVDDLLFEDLTENINGTIDQLGMSSWSSDMETANDFATQNALGSTPNAVVFVMHGGTSIGRKISEYSNYPNEEEVLVSSRSLQKITKVRESNGITYIDVKEVA